MARKDDVQAPEQLKALQNAIALCGSRRELARRISRYVPSFSSQRIDNWFHRDGSVVPVDIAPFVAAAVNGQVSVFDLRPDYTGWQVLKELLTAPGQPRRERQKKQVSVASQVALPKD